MTEIELLIPHRNPFLFLDELPEVSTQRIVGTKIFSDTDVFLTSSFPENQFVPGVVLIEAMAQCGGAGIKKLGLAGGIFALAQIENVSFLRGVPYQKNFKMDIQNIKISEKFVKQTGIGWVGSEQCIEATWTCIKFSD